MITFREVLAFLAPVITAGLISAVLFQIVDRLNDKMKLFYQDGHKQFGVHGTGMFRKRKVA